MRTQLSSTGACSRTRHGWCTSAPPLTLPRLRWLPALGTNPSVLDQIHFAQLQCGRAHLRVLVLAGFVEIDLRIESILKIWASEGYVGFDQWSAQRVSCPTLVRRYWREKVKTAWHWPHICLGTRDWGGVIRN